MLGSVTKGLLLITTAGLLALTVAADATDKCDSPRAIDIATEAIFQQAFSQHKIKDNVTFLRIGWVSKSASAEGSRAEGAELLGGILQEADYEMMTRSDVVVDTLAFKKMFNFSFASPRQRAVDDRIQKQYCLADVTMTFDVQSGLAKWQANLDTLLADARATGSTDAKLDELKEIFKPFRFGGVRTGVEGLSRTVVVNEVRNPPIVNAVEVSVAEAIQRVAAHIRWSNPLSYSIQPIADGKLYVTLE